MTLTAAERRLLGQMPLHAITSVHGEAGLRERLTIETAGFLLGERERAGEALALASRLHAGEQREPYVNHLLRVCVRILSHYRVHDIEVACAALLHDAVEDHADQLAPGCGHEAALRVLAGRCGERVADLVASVANHVYEPGRDPLRRDLAPGRTRRRIWPFNRTPSTPFPGADRRRQAPRGRT